MIRVFTQVSGEPGPGAPSVDVTHLQPMDRETPLPGVSVVIPTRGGRADLLDSLLGSVSEDPAAREVVVVLDGKDEATEAVLARRSVLDTRVRGLRHAEATPALGARERGAETAREEVLLMLDDDLAPAPFLVTGHARYHEKRAGLVVQGYTPIPTPDGGWPAGSAVNRLYSESYERACAAFRADPDSVLSGMWGGNFSIRRRDWLQAQRSYVPTTAYPHEDRALGLHLRQFGLRGVFDPLLRADHLFSRSAGEFLDWTQRSGVAQIQLRRAHPHLSDAAPPSVPTRVLQNAARLSLPFKLLSSLLLAAGRVSIAMQWTRLEYFCVRAIAVLGVAGGLRRAEAEGRRAAA